MTRRRRTSNRTQRHRKKVYKKYRTKKYQRVRIQKKSKTSRKTRRRRRKTFKKGGAFCTRKSPQDFCDGRARGGDAFEGQFEEPEPEINVDDGLV